MKSSLFLTTYFFFISIAAAQPNIEWQVCLGGSDAEDVLAFRRTADGGYIFAGFSGSNDGDVSGWQGAADLWVVKINESGQIQWQRMLGGTDRDFAEGVIQTSDGGYLVVGKTYSNDGHVTVNYGEDDMWIVRLDSQGNILWTKIYGGSRKDIGSSALETSDGGFVVAGYSSSSDGDLSSNMGAYDFWILRLDNMGNLQWEKSYGGSKLDQAHAIVEATDGGYIVAGETWSDDGDIVGNNGNTDNWIIKISEDGELEWQKALGGTGADVARSIVATTDGGYAIVGECGSYNTGQVFGSYGFGDLWAVKLSSVGEVEWQRPLGGSDTDWGGTIRQTVDGGYIVAGSTFSTDEDALGNDGGKDSWLIKLDPSGNVLWHTTYGGTYTDWSRGVEQSTDGGYITVGYTWSDDGDVSGYHGTQDVWVVKFFPETVGVGGEMEHLPMAVFPNPATHSISLINTSLSASVEDGTVLSLRISDVLGHEVGRRFVRAGEAVDISVLPNGTYLLRATTPGGQVLVGKFLKQG